MNQPRFAWKLLRKKPLPKAANEVLTVAIATPLKIKILKIFRRKSPAAPNNQRKKRLEKFKGWA